MAYCTRTDGAAVAFRGWLLAVVPLLTPMAAVRMPRYCLSFSYLEDILGRRFLLTLSQV